MCLSQLAGYSNGPLSSDWFSVRACVVAVSVSLIVSVKWVER